MVLGTRLSLVQGFLRQNNCVVSTANTPNHLNKQRHFQSSRRFLSSMTDSVLEIEQKFAVSPETEKKLMNLGFEKIKDFSMVDWYFDFQGFPLIQRDAWLRFRHLLHGNDPNKDLDKGQWEIKVGKNGINKQPKNGKQQTTAYQEFVGEEAFSIIQRMELDLPNDPKDIVYDEYKELVIPKPMMEMENVLVPFGRIVTKRSTWKRLSIDDESKMSVDLDQTDFGYNVGEVEIVIPTSNDESLEDGQKRIDEAKELIDGLIHQITGPTEIHENGSDRDDGPAKGKLEYFLYHEKPEIYYILRKAGLMP